MCSRPHAQGLFQVVIVQTGELPFQVFHGQIARKRDTTDFLQSQDHFLSIDPSFLVGGESVVSGGHQGNIPLIGDCHESPFVVQLILGRVGPSASRDERETGASRMITSSP
jgi:hypothetical protein